jgi:lysophospholipase L1-like esterase
MITRARPLGLRVAVTDVLPWNNGHPAADDAVEEVNRRIEAVAAAEGTPVLGFHDALESRSEPGTMPGRLTIDGDHPSVAGYRLLGERVVAPYLRRKAAPEAG